MIDKKIKHKVVTDFVKSFSDWIETNQACIDQKIIDKSWEKEVKNKYSFQEITAAIFPKWDKLHKADNEKAEELIKKTKDLLIILVSNYKLGNDIFKDFKIRIYLDYNESHLRKIS